MTPRTKELWKSPLPILMIVLVAMLIYVATGDVKVSIAIALLLLGIGIVLRTWLVWHDKKSERTDDCFKNPEQ